MVFYYWHYIGAFILGPIARNLHSNIEKRDPLVFLKEFKGSRSNQSIYLISEIFVASCFFCLNSLFNGEGGIRTLVKLP